MASEPGLHNCSFVASSSRIADFSAVISMGDCQPGTFLRNQETVLRRNRAEQMQNETGTETMRAELIEHLLPIHTFSRLAHLLREAKEHETSLLPQFEEALAILNVQRAQEIRTMASTDDVKTVAYIL